MELAISIFSLLVAAFSLLYSFIVHRQTVSHDKKQATLDAFNTLQEQVLDKLNVFTDSRIKEISEDVHSKEYKTISTLMARIEHFSVGVNADIYDIETVKRLAGKHFCALYRKLLPMVEKKRKINKTDKHYDEFEILVSGLKCLYHK